MNKKVVVIGGGIIGISSAICLAERGAKVIVIEKNKARDICSYGNAGWITPCFALPLAMPGMFFKSLKWMIDPNGPLYIKPSPSVDLMNWLIRFLKAMNTKQAMSATEALVKLSRKSLELYRNLAQDKTLSFDYQEKGLLMVAESEESHRALLEELNYVSKFGVRGEVFTESQVKEKEPQLKCNLKGGLFFPDEVHVDPNLLLSAMKKKAIHLGVTIMEDTTFLKVKKSQSKITKVVVKNNTTSNETELDADCVVLATGSWSKSIAPSLNITAPIFGGKGYSMRLPNSHPPIGQPIMVLDRKLAITPHENYLRIAGTLELVDQDFSITTRRANNILKGAQFCLGLDPKTTLSDVEDLWAGLRPCSPDGVPMIGAVKNYDNLFVAIGHQMLGLQSGFGTGYLIADLIEGKKSDLDAAVFDPNRF